MKSVLSVKNFIILFLMIAVIVLSVLAFDNKEKCIKANEKVDVSYNSNGDYKSLCQREYYFTENDSYLVSLCDNKLYINKNNSEDIEIEIKDAAYLYKFIKLDTTSLYVLSTKGEVYYLSPKNIENDSYKLEKLDYKNILDIKAFVGGAFKEDAYENVIYAIDNKGKMNEIK